MIHGSIPALVTPFTRDGAFDEGGAGGIPVTANIALTPVG